MMRRISSIIFILFFGLWVSCAYCDSSKPRRISTGVTFSQVQCEYLGIDWKDAYKKTLAMQFDVIRLGAYWNRIEKEEGVYDFRELDWQLRLARQKGTRILLTVGMKAPRWPEFHLPAWLSKNIKITRGRNAAAGTLIQEKTLQFIAAVVNRYKEEPHLIAWQVENEPLDKSGPDNWWVSRDFLQREIFLVSAADKNKRPIVVNAATYPNRLLRILSRLRYIRNPVYQVIDLAEVPAINIYSAIGHKVSGMKVCLFSAQNEYKKYFKDIISYAEERGKKMWVTELQAEPWEPGQLVHLTEGGAISCWPGSFLRDFNDITAMNVDTVLLWGVEYWIYRKDVRKDDSWVKTARDILAR